MTNRPTLPVTDHPGTAVADATPTRARSDICIEICGRIVAGESTVSIFDHTPAADYPDRATFWRWRQADEDLRKQYEEAVAERAEKYAEEIAHIADEVPPKVATEFGEHADSGHVAWQRNRIDARKWIACKLLPKRYGDRTVLAGDADNPLAIEDARDILARKLAKSAAGGGTSGST